MARADDVTFVSANTSDTRHPPCNLSELLPGGEDRFMQPWKARILTTLVLATALSGGCAQQSSDENNSDQLPFEYTADKSGISPTASLIPADIPAGTPITIRLQAAISSIASHSGDGFDAVLDKPILFQGQTIAPAGSAVRGKVLTAKASGRTQDPGFLRITLTEISLKGRVLSLRTSSIFVKGSSREKRKLSARGGADLSTRNTLGLHSAGAKDAGFYAEQRLTFRLTQAWPGQS